MWLMVWHGVWWASFRQHIDNTILIVHQSSFKKSTLPSEMPFTGSIIAWLSICPAEGNQLFKNAKVNCCSGFVWFADDD